MRLIDAEALKEALQSKVDLNQDDPFDRGYNIGIEAAIDLLDNAPTVETGHYLTNCQNCQSDYSRGYDDGYKEGYKAERPHGKWSNVSPYTVHCSVCNKNSPDMSTYIKMNFCPNCGAKMDKEAENDKNN